MRCPPDLLPESAFAKILAVGAGALFVVEPRYLWAVLLLFILNTVATLVLTHKRNGEYIDLFHSLVYRGVSYLIVIPTVIILSVIWGDMQVLRQYMFAGIGGVEAAFTVATVARINPQIRPLYLSILQWINDNTPIEAKADQIDQIINDQHD